MVPRKVKRFKKTLATSCIENGVDPELVQACLDPKDVDASGDVSTIMANIGNCYNSLPQKSPFRTSFGKELFTGDFFLCCTNINWKIGTSPQFMASSLNMTDRNARNILDTEAHNISYYVSNLVSLRT